MVTVKVLGHVGNYFLHKRKLDGAFHLSKGVNVANELQMHLDGRLAIAFRYPGLLLKASLYRRIR